ncbi:MAG: alpha/beta hydrolase [Sedimentisphaerales bacterium]|nr:alpha/beta hydrolase [Sedimentisphaerales bacterium]
MKHFTITLGVILALFLTAPGIYADQEAVDSTPSYKTISDISYFDIDSNTPDEYRQQQCKLDLYVPLKESGFATVVWFHGGGLTTGDKSIPQQLKNRNIAVVAVGYRLYPKVSCPVYIEDAAASIAWAFKHIEDYGGDPNLIFLSGHSAGGYLAAITGIDKKWLAQFGIDANNIAGIIPFSGHMITHFTIRQERGIPGMQPIIDEFAPLFHVRNDAPPLVLITGDRNLELLGRYEENAYMMRMMKVIGHQQTSLYEIQGFDHGGMADPAFSLLLKHVNEIVESYKKREGHS